MPRERPGHHRLARAEGKRTEPNMPDGQYKGWLIEPQSYQSDDDRWHPKAMVSIFPVLAPVDVKFDTEQDANAYAIEMAKKWIDARG